MSLQSLTQELYSSFESKAYDKCEKLLIPLKIELIKNGLLIPIIDEKTSKDKINDFKISQHILELGSLSSLLIQNYSSFENYYSQLKPFYSNNKLQKSLKDTQSTKIISLYLVYLISQGEISKFHMELENLSYYQHFDLVEDKYLAFPVTLEKNLMEGNYIKIWNGLNNSDNLPGVEYNVFIDTLVNALRYEIAKSLEKTYTSIPIDNCKNLLYCPQEESDSGFIQMLVDDLGINWNFKNGYVFFNNDDMEDLKFDNSKIINNVLNYADQIESIV